MIELPNWNVIRSSEQYGMLLIMHELEHADFVHDVKAVRAPETYADLKEIANETRNGCEISVIVDNFVDSLNDMHNRDEIVRQLPYINGFVTILMPDPAAFTDEDWRDLDNMHHAENN